MLTEVEVEKPETEPDCRFTYQDGMVTLITQVRQDPATGELFIEIPLTPPGTEKNVAEAIKRKWPEAIKGGGEIWLDGDSGRLQFWEECEAEAAS